MSKHVKLDQNVVWVVEMRGRSRWKPVAVEMSRNAAIAERREWERANPNDLFRHLGYKLPCMSKHLAQPTAEKET